MKIEEARSSFTVFVIGTQQARLHEVSDALGKAGYMVAYFAKLTEAISELASNPPHFLVFDFNEEGFNLPQAVLQVQTQLPESHVLIACKVEDRPRATLYLERGVYDLVYLPAMKPTEIVVRFDHAAERDYFMYLNERLMENPPTVPESHRQKAAEETGGSGATLGVPQDYFAVLMSELFQQRTVDDCIQTFLTSVSQLLGDCPGLFLKFIANRRMLAAAHGYKVEEANLRGLGVDFNQHSQTFRISQLRKPEELPEIQSLAREVFQQEDFMAYPIESLGEIYGVLLLLSGKTTPTHRAMVNMAISLLDRVVGLLEAQRRLHTTSVKDSATEVYTRVHFLARATEEVARSRRTSTPVAMILFAVDQFGHMLNTYGTEEANTILRMLLRIIEKHSRVNDVLGRLGTDEFGIILPHTHLKGALIKAERLRRIIESADFSKVIASMPSLTISLGVSEYPTLCRDADELKHTADEALYHVRREQNRVCAATAPDGFVADFSVHDKGP